MRNFGIGSARAAGVKPRGIFVYPHRERVSLPELVVTLMLVALPALGGEPPTIPTLREAPAVTDAPGRGARSATNPAVLMPSLYDLDAQPFERISPLVQRQLLGGVQSTMVKWTVKAGGRFPLHHHVNEQITWITQGRCEVYSQNKRFILTAGRVLIIPPNTPHEFVCTEDTIDIDFFAPQRQDWIDGAASVAASP